MLSNVARVPEMWLVYMEMCCSVNYTPDFKDFVKKKKDGKTHTIFLRVEMVFQISWAKKKFNTNFAIFKLYFTWLLKSLKLHRCSRYISIAQCEASESGLYT